MSNRAKWAHQTGAKRRSSRARIPVGLAFLVVGITLLFGAVEGMRTGIFMFPTFDFRTSSFGYGETIGLLIMGLGLAVAGVVVLLVRD